MEERVEKIIESIEQSFNKLNTSVELLKKAEDITTSTVGTSSQLINEFESTISKIEQLVKHDFAKEYNKVVTINNQLLKKLDDIDFKGNFEQIFGFAVSNNEIIDSFQKPINTLSEKFQEVKTRIDNKNFNTNFKKIEYEIEKSKELVEGNLNHIYETLLSQNYQQRKEIKIIKIISFSIVLILIATLSIIFFRNSNG